MLDGCIPHTSIRWFLRRTARLPLVFLIRHHSSAPGDPDRDPGRIEELTERLTSIKPYLRRANVIDIETNCSFGLSAINSVLQTVATPGLDRFTVMSRLFRHSPAALRAVSAKAWMNNYFAALRTLDIYNTPLPFDLVSFPVLQTLRIVSVSVPIRFSVAQFARLVNGSPMLKSMVLIYVTCSDVTSIREPPVITASALLRLTLRMSVDGSLPRLVALMKMENLQTLRLAMRRHRDVANSLFCADAFRSTRTLELADTCCNWVDAAPFFAMFPLVTTLDLRSCIESMLPIVNAISASHLVDGRTTILPRIEKLLLAAEKPAAVQDFVLCRGVTDGGYAHNAVIQTIRVDCRLDSGREDVQVIKRWLKSRVPDFHLRFLK
ncbi:hypothetical protein C8R43DRAFT_1120230 [Mycena crocata]|nr:hypothetical protein C8R43DRAFT_1120230 [Mycena crocata]